MAEVKYPKVGEPVPSKADGNPEPSLSDKEGVETGRGVRTAVIKCRIAVRKGTVRPYVKILESSLAYGMSEFKLSSTMEIEVKKAKDIINKFFSVVPKVKEFLDTLGNTGKTRGYIKTAPPYSRIRWFPDWQAAVNNFNDYSSFATLGEIERQSKNTPIQGTNADVIKDVLRTLYRIKMSDIKWDNVKIILAVYDENRSEVPEELAEEWRQITETTMVQCAEKVLTKVPIVADCVVTDAWEK